MATGAFRYPFDISSTLEPWRHELGHSFDDVVAHLSDRDRALEDYVDRVIYDRVSQIVTFGGGEHLDLGAWASWTPILTNLTLGNGSVLAKFARIGCSVAYRFVFTLGSTSAVGTDPSFSLPFSLAASYVDAVDIIGDINFHHAGVQNNRGQVWTEGGRARIVGYTATGVAAQVTATVPFTWASGDHIACLGVYEAVPQP